MVEVAIKKARNPVAVVANQFNMPEVAQSQPPLPLPGKLMIPRFVPPPRGLVILIGGLLIFKYPSVVYKVIFLIVLILTMIIQC